MNTFHPNTLQGKTAILTGGTGGLGSAIALGLAQAGATVVLTGRSRERMNVVVHAIQEAGGNAECREMDVADPSSIRDCAKEVHKRHGEIHTLVNGIGGNDASATTSDDRSFFDLLPDDLSTVLDLNWMRGSVLPSQAFGGLMLSNTTGGSIINISSMAALRPLTRVVAYSSAKAAVDNFTQWLAVHLAKEYSANLRVNAVAPGFFLTDQNRYLLTGNDGELTERGETIIAHTPMSRFGEPEEVADAVVWLASDAARFVTGIVLPVDGGFSAFAGVWYIDKNRKTHRNMSLKNHKPKHDFFIAVDSDGCVFDTMELKHKECFIPNIIKYWGLQAVSKYARQTAEFVNLYSKWRGINRFPALTMTFDLLAKRPEIKSRGIPLPEVPNLRKWMETESKLGNPALKKYCASHKHEDMHRALAWSEAVNDTIGEFVHAVPPFPHVKDCLQEAAESADLLVCSATPHDALQREWAEHDIERYVFSIAGQEQGKKSEHIAQAAGGRYAADRVLMIGDAPGDMAAAKANDALFYPIMPGEEERSWKRFQDEALAHFLNGTYAGAYEGDLVAEFDRALPESPPWN